MLLELFNPGETCQGQPKVARSSQGSKADEESSQMSLTLTRVQTATRGSKAECCSRGWIRMSSGMKWSSLYTPLKTISIPKQLRIWAVKSWAIVLGQTQMKPGGEAPQLPSVTVIWVTDSAVSLDYQPPSLTWYWMVPEHNQMCPLKRVTGDTITLNY